MKKKLRLKWRQLAPVEQVEFHRLHSKSLRELNTVVRTYGPNTPFILSVLESIPRGGYLLPREWAQVVQSVLTRGQFLSWKADFLDHCQSTAVINQKSTRSPSVTWSFEKLSGQGKCATETRQRHFPIDLLAQTTSTASVPGGPFRSKAQLSHL